MADSNRARDVYVDKEQDKFFRRVNWQRADIDALKEWMEWSELRARALELENESLLARLDSMVDKLCFCTRAEVTSQVVGSELSSWRKTDVILPRLIKPSPRLSTPMNLQIIRRTLKHMLNRVCLSKLCQSHWGQRGYYPGGKLRVFWEFLTNIPSICPLGKLRIFWNFISHFALNKPSG